MLAAITARGRSRVDNWESASAASSMARRTSAPQLATSRRTGSIDASADGSSNAVSSNTLVSALPGFVDEQRRGPYRWWIHTHMFEPRDGGTDMVDHVDYQPRGGRLVGLFVAPDLRRIFRYRHRAIREALGLPPLERLPPVEIRRR